LQCVAVCCSVLQCVAVCCSVFQKIQISSTRLHTSVYARVMCGGVEEFSLMHAGKYI